MKLHTLSAGAGLLVLILGIGQVHAVFDDVPGDSAVGNYVNDLESRGLVEGYADGLYRPSNLVNRAEFLKVLMKATGHEHASIQRCVTEGDMTRCMPSLKCFSDFKGDNPEWYWNYACSAKAAGIIDGYPDGTFGGNRWVNVAEAVKMTVDAFGMPLPQYFRAPDTGHGARERRDWYDPYMDTAASTTAFETVPKIPNHLLTRGEMAALIGSFVTVEGRSCFSSNDCEANQYCSTENGDCFSACKPGAEACIQACSGFCKAEETIFQ